MSADLNPIEILIVDDEPSIRLLLKRWIERSLTAKVREAADGLQALEAIAEGGVEMVISDINMPVLNGIEMLSLLHADPSRKRIEVLVASQVANEDKVRQVIELGVSDYLLKPLQYDWVIARLKRAADRIYERRAVAPDSSLTRVLVFDGDPNYCAFAESALAGDFSVETARTVAETLIKALRFKPDVLLFCPDTPGLNVRFLLDRLEGLPGGDPPAIYELTSKKEPSAEGLAGVLPRTFVPETLRLELIRLLRGGEAPEHGVLAWASSLESEMRTALFQALGMLTGVEPEDTADAPDPEKGRAYGWIDINADDGDFTMRLDLDCGRDLAIGLLRAMVGEEPGEDDGSEPSLDALQEILNVVAGRLKNSCLERKIDVSIGLPVTGFEPPKAREAQFEHAEWFRWSGSQPFRLRYDAMPCQGA
ncbi:MAG: response regulator [Bryobacterales bacterium]